MRNVKKLLAVLMVVAIMATMFAVPAFAETTISDEAAACETLGMLIGRGDGVTPEYTAENVDRVQAALVFLRLQGVDEEALAYEGEDNFADADTYAPWGRPVMAFLKDNPEYGFIGDGTNFLPNTKFTAQMYAKVLLNALGYTVGTDEDADIQYADAIDEAAELGIESLVDKEIITIDDLAVATIEALKATVKDGTDSLAQTLVDAGIISLADAEEAGVISSELTATAEQTGVKEITVDFNRALTAAEKTAATITVKNGLVPYTLTATWAEDNKSVVLEYAYALFAGDYTVTVGGIADPMTVPVVAEKVAKIELTDEYLQLKDNYAIGYKVYNQFGEEMTATLNWSAFDATKGIALSVDLTGAVADLDLLTDVAAPLSAKDDSVIITASHAGTGINVAKTLVVKSAASAAALQFGAVAPLTGSTRVSVNQTGLEIPYTFADQYGKALKLATRAADIVDDNTTVIDGVTFITSDATIVDPDTFSVDANNKLLFNTGAVAGTAVITALVPSTGATATIAIKVEATPALKTFQISAPAALVVQGESVVIPYVAADTFGAQIAKADFVQGASVTFVSSNDAIINDATDFTFDGKTHDLKLDPTGTGTATVYVYVGGALQSTVTFDVKAVAIPTKIVGLKNVPSLFQAGASIDLSAANINMVDQYNRPIAPGAIDTDNNAGTADVVYTVEVSYDTGYTGTKVSVTQTTISDTSVNTHIAGVAAGTEKMVFAIEADGAAVAGTQYSASFTTVADADIASYAIQTVPTLYANAAYTSSAAAGNYAKVVTVIGKTTAGADVTINQSAITALSSSDPSVVAVDSATKEVYSAAKGTATIAAWKGATKVAEIAVTASDAAPVATSVSFDATKSYTIADAATLNLITTNSLVVVDQYGVTITATAVGTWSSSDTAKATVNAGVVTNLANGTATITFVTNNGLVASQEVTLL